MGKFPLNSGMVEVIENMFGFWGVVFVTIHLSYSVVDIDIDITIVVIIVLFFYFLMLRHGRCSASRIIRHLIVLYHRD